MNFQGHKRCNTNRNIERRFRRLSAAGPNPEAVSIMAARKLRRQAANPYHVSAEGYDFIWRCAQHRPRERQVSFPSRFRFCQGLSRRRQRQCWAGHVERGGRRQLLGLRYRRQGRESAREGSVPEPRGSMICWALATVRTGTRRALSGVDREAAPRIRRSQAPNGIPIASHRLRFNVLRAQDGSHYWSPSLVGLQLAPRHGQAIVELGTPSSTWIIEEKIKIANDNVFSHFCAAVFASRLQSTSRARHVRGKDRRGGARPDVGRRMAACRHNNSSCRPWSYRSVGG